MNSSKLFLTVAAIQGNVYRNRRAGLVSIAAWAMP